MEELGTQIRIGNLVLNREDETLSLGGKCEKLSDLSTKLLWALIEARGKIVSYADLREIVWDGNQVGEEALKQRIKILRDQIASLGGDSGVVETVRGKGCRLSVPIEAYKADDNTAFWSKVRRVTLYLIGSILVFAFFTGLYENAYTPYRLKNTSVRIMPIAYEGMSTSSQQIEFDDQVMNAMVSHSGLGVLAAGSQQEPEYVIRIEVRKDRPHHQGRALVVREADKQVEGLYVFKLRPSMSVSEFDSIATAIAENVATIIRGFPKPE